MMSKSIRFLCVMLAILVFFVQDGYALWGRKKTSEPVPKVEQKTDEEPVVVQEKKVEKEVKKEAKQEVKTEEPKKAAAKEEKSADVQKKIEEDKMLRQKKRQKLNNTKWEIEIKAIGAQAKTQVDSLIFEDNRFYSDISSKEGFNATNYTISIKDEWTIVWETMQTAEEGKINFWRGEISDDMKSMKGIASKKNPEGIAVNYSFTSTSKKVIE